MQTVPYGYWKPAPGEIAINPKTFCRVDRARDRTSGGSGIGLAIAKAIIEAHGGTIDATSAGAGRGTTFCVRLPTG